MQKVTRKLYKIMILRVSKRRNGVKDYRSRLFTVSTTVTGVCNRERFSRKRGGKEPLAVKVETVRGMLKINVTVVGKKGLL